MEVVHAIRKLSFVYIYDEIFKFIDDWKMRVKKVSVFFLDWLSWFAVLVKLFLHDSSMDLIYVGVSSGYGWRKLV